MAVHVMRVGCAVFTMVVLSVSTAVAASPAHKAVRYGEHALAFSSGFIREDVPADGVVAKTTYNRQVIGQGDTMYLAMKYPEEERRIAIYGVPPQPQSIPSHQRPLPGKPDFNCRRRSGGEDGQ